MADALETVLLAAGRRNTLRLVRVAIVTGSPLTVQLPDGSTVPGQPVLGLTYTAGAAALALIAEGIVPPCLPV